MVPDGFGMDALLGLATFGVAAVAYRYLSATTGSP
jgi:hypothetical protein